MLNPRDIYFTRLNHHWPRRRSETLERFVHPPLF